MMDDIRYPVQTIYLNQMRNEKPDIRIRTHRFI